MKKLIYLFTLIVIFMFCFACNDNKEVTLSYEENEIVVYVGDTINIKPILSTKDEVGLNYELSSEIAFVDLMGNFVAEQVGVVVVTVSLRSNPDVKAEITVKIIEDKDFVITLDVNGGDPLESTLVCFDKGEKVTLPEPERYSYEFLGWFENGVLVENVEERNYDLIAKWRLLGTYPVVSYVIEEGVLLSCYDNREELVKDLIKDIQTIKGSSYNKNYFDTYSGSGEGIFVGLEGESTLFANETMHAKWSWLLDYAKELRTSAGYDVSQYDSAIEKGFVGASAETINVELIGFILGKEYSFESTKSVDYSVDSNKNGYALKLHAGILHNNAFKKGTLLSEIVPTATKEGAYFVGWYTSSDYGIDSKINSTTVLKSNTVVYARFVYSSTVSEKVTFDYAGGVSESIYKKYGTKVSTLKVSSYNGDYWSGTPYTSNIYISTSAKDPKAQYATRIYIAKDKTTGVYNILSILPNGTKSAWPTGAEYVITISNQYSGSLDDGLTIDKVNLDTVVLLDKELSATSSSSPLTVTFYDPSVTSAKIEEVITNNSVLPIPTKVGHTFLGWYDEYDNKYEKPEDFLGLGSVKVTAKWKVKDIIIGSYVTESWVVAGEAIELLAKYSSNISGQLLWLSKDPSIATVDQNGLVVGVKEGLAEIIVRDADALDVSFTYYVTVLNENPTGLLKVILDSNNERVFTKDELIIGITGSSGTYYTDIVGSVSKLLFEDYEVYDTYYLSSPNNKTTLSNGIEFITVHYAADMVGNATNGGRNLASYNKSCNTSGTQASWHFSTGNDGIWACQTESYGAWHAGSSKTMTWHKTGIMYKSTDPEFAKITLGSDNYFYLNGQKTSVKNTTGGSKLNGMGLAFKVSGGEYYIGGFYYNTSYKYISSTGGNNNSIGIETSCAKGSDLWLTWQYTAQLCAKLLIKYNLPLKNLVGHHFFSGKWCPQPMLENDLEIWYEFVELVRQEKAYFENYSSSSMSFSSNSKYLANNGRVTSLPKNTECVTYTVTYTVGSTTKTVTLSSVLPGTLA